MANTAYYACPRCTELIIERFGVEGFEEGERRLGGWRGGERGEGDMEGEEREREEGEGERQEGEEGEEGEGEDYVSESWISVY